MPFNNSTSLCPFFINVCSSSDYRHTRRPLCTLQTVSYTATTKGPQDGAPHDRDLVHLPYVPSANLPVWGLRGMYDMYG